MKQFTTCPECVASVLVNRLQEHQRWHERLRQVLCVAGVEWTVEQVDQKGER